MLVLKQSTAVDIRMGPFVDATDGVTPETGITLGAADQAEVLKADGAATVAMGGTFAAVTGADGWYDYTCATGDVDTVGEVVFVVQDSSVCLPVFVRAQVVEEATYDMLYASGATPLADINAECDTALTDYDAVVPADLPTNFADLSITATTGRVDLDSVGGDSVSANAVQGGTHETTISGAPASQTSFVLAAGSADDDAYNGYACLVVDSATATQRALGVVSDYTGSTKTITLDADPGIFTFAANDLIYLLPGFLTTTVDANVTQISGDATAADNLELDYDGTGYAKANSTIGTCTTNTDMRGTDSAATAANLATVDTNVDTLVTRVPNTLNTTASGNIGIDWANVENPTTAVDLSATDIQLCDTVTTNTDMRGTDSAATAANLATVDTVVDAIKAKTDSLTFTQAGEVDANVQSINDAAVTGDGNATPWDGA